MCAPRVAARLRHHGDQSHGLDRRGIFSCLRRAHGARRRGRVRASADGRGDRCICCAGFCSRRESSARSISPAPRWCSISAAPSPSGLQPAPREALYAALSHGRLGHHRDGSLSPDRISGADEVPSVASLVAGSLRATRTEPQDCSSCADQAHVPIEPAAAVCIGHASWRAADAMLSWRLY